MIGSSVVRSFVRSPQFLAWATAGMLVATLTSVPSSFRLFSSPNPYPFSHPLPPLPVFLSSGVSERGGVASEGVLVDSALHRRGRAIGR